MDNTIVVSEPNCLRTAWADRAGLVASLACAVHCAAMPIVIGYLPSLRLAWMASERFHQWMAVICAVIAFLAFVPGFRRHRRFAPGVLGLVGIVFLSSAAFVLEPCCPSCESLQASAVSSCEACDSLGETCESMDATVSAATTTPWLGKLNGYVTPLGGCVLILAHLLNHRVGCSCCWTNTTNLTTDKEVAHGP